MKKKLLVFHPVVDLYRLDFFNRFSDAYDMNMVMFADNTAQNIDYSTIENQLKFPFEYNILSRVGLVKWVRNIIHYIRKQQPDFIMTTEFGLSTLLSVLFRLFSSGHFKIVSIVDDSYDMVANGHSFTLKHRLATVFLMPFLDDIIVVEPKVAAYYQEHYGKGICMPILTEENKFRAALSKALPLSSKYVEQYQLEGKKVLLYVGRLAKVKNIGFAIRAFREANVENSVFVIVGDGAEREQLERLASGADNILFMGKKLGEELHAWYNIAQLFILPSLTEPFGAVTNEALLAGCRVLVSNRAGSSCLVKEGKNGYMLAPNDINSTVSLLQQTLTLCAPTSVPLEIRDSNMQDSFEERMRTLLETMDKIQN